MRVKPYLASFVLLLLCIIQFGWVFFWCSTFAGIETASLFATKAAAESAYLSDDKRAGLIALQILTAQAERLKFCPVRYPFDLEEEIILSRLRSASLLTELGRLPEADSERGSARTLAIKHWGEKRASNSHLDLFLRANDLAIEAH